MEVYAAFMEHTDHHVGRMIDALKDMGELDNTLIYLIIGDNGASAEGTLQGAFNEMANFNGVPEIETPEFMMSKIDEFGGEGSYGHYAVGLGVGDELAVPVDEAGRLALGRHAQRRRRALAEGHQGKGRHPQPVQPRHRHRADGARSGRPARADSSSTACSRARTKARACCTASTSAKAPERHETQYFEMFCNRGIYHKGWSAVTKHRTPWEMKGAASCRRSTTTCGSSTTAARTGRRRTTWRRRCRRSCTSCSGCGSSKP